MLYLCSPDEDIFILYDDYHFYLWEEKYFPLYMDSEGDFFCDGDFYGLSTKDNRFLF
jgi:hypothetical protein